VIGLLMGLAVAFASQLFSHTLDRREEVERELGLPVLAAMPVSSEMRQPI
jgi:capsular polysaccharide biosynthesis protein